MSWLLPNGPKGFFLWLETIKTIAFRSGDRSKELVEDVNWNIPMWRLKDSPRF